MYTLIEEPIHLLLKGLFLEAMARRALWDVGLDYGHETGHGIGANLNVHEYPPWTGTENQPPGMLSACFYQTSRHITIRVSMGFTLRILFRWFRHRIGRH